MSYAEKLLADGEVVVLRTRQHPLALIKDARNGLVLWIVAVALVGLVPLFSITRPVADYISYLAIGCLVVGLVIVIWQYLLWWTEEYVVTNRRMMKVSGVINKRSSDSSLEKINDAILVQRFWGRVFNYGDLDILTASDQTVDSYRMLNAAPVFKKTMLNQKHALELEYASGRATSPPLRTGPVDMNGERVAQPAAAQPAPPEFAPPASTAATLSDPLPMPSSTMPMESVSGPAPEVAAAAPTAQAAPTASASPEKPTLPPPQPPAAESAGGTAKADNAAFEITQTLARLADLRDRGAISEQEFQAKKAQLLDRL